MTLSLTLAPALKRGVIINHFLFFLSCHIWLVIIFHKNIEELSQNIFLFSNTSATPTASCLIIPLHLGNFSDLNSYSLCFRLLLFLTILFYSLIYLIKPNLAMQFLDVNTTDDSRHEICHRPPAVFFYRLMSEYSSPGHTHSRAPQRHAMGPWTWHLSLMPSDIAHFSSFLLKYHLASYLFDKLLLLLTAQLICALWEVIPNSARFFFSFLVPHVTFSLW